MGRFAQKLGQKKKDQRQNAFVKEVLYQKELLLDLAEKGLVTPGDIEQVFNNLVRLSYDEAAALCGVAKITIKKRVIKHNLEPALKVGQYPLYTLGDIERINNKISHAHTKRARGEETSW